MIGRFIEGHFHAEQESRPLGVGPVYYAAQSYSGAPDNRRVRIGWHRLSIPDARFSQQMGVPCEITLARHADGFALCQQPVKEIEALREKHTVWEQTIDKTEAFPLEGGAQDLLITAPKEDTPFSLTLRGCMIGWDPTSGCWQANGLELPLFRGTRACASSPTQLLWNCSRGTAPAAVSVRLKIFRPRRPCVWKHRRRLS